MTDSVEWRFRVRQVPCFHTLNKIGSILVTLWRVLVTVIAMEKQRYILYFSRTRDCHTSKVFIVATKVLL
jgi:hypothetical protein